MCKVYKYMYNICVIFYLLYTTQAAVSMFNWPNFRCLLIESLYQENVKSTAYF